MAVSPSPYVRALEELIMGKVPRGILYKGGAEGHCLYYGDDAAVQRNFLKAGTKFEEHSHGSTEIVVVLSGKFHSDSTGIATITPVAGVIIFLPGVAHSHWAETDCRVIGILVPCEVGYPDGR